MAKQKPSLNTADIDLLKKTFTTKDDLENFATKDDLKKLASKKDIKNLDKKFDRLFDFIDRDISNFKTKVAEHLDVDVSEFASPVK